VTSSELELEGEGAEMSKVRWAEPALLNGSSCSGGPIANAEFDPIEPLRAGASRETVAFPRQRAEPHGRSRAALNPLPVGLAVAGGTELLASLRLAGRARHLGGPVREAAAVRVLQAGALAASARRPGWRVPLISSAIALRVLGLIGDSGGRRSKAGLALWLLALCQLRREAARAEAWDAPPARRV
jgi:hypothetical protein